MEYDWSDGRVCLFDGCVGGVVVVFVGCVVDDVVGLGLHVVAHICCSQGAIICILLLLLPLFLLKLRDQCRTLPTAAALA